MVRFIVSGFILLLWLLVLIKGKKHFSGYSSKIHLEDKLFLGLFFIFLILPISYLHDKEVNRWENRNYYPLPAFFNKGTFNKNFGPQFDDYFSDHILGRKDMINVSSFLDKINKKQRNDKVLFGKENWLFYKFDNSIANFKNEVLFNEGELQLILDNIRYIQSFNKKVYILIPPDKNKIYGEFYPDEIQKTNPDKNSRAEQFVQFMNANGIPTIYPYQSLHENKSKGLLYYKHGTHWNQMGAEVAFSDFLKILKKDFPNLLYVSATTFEEDNKPDLDLENMSPNFKDFDTQKYQKPVIRQTGEKKLKVYVFTDSFFEALSPFFNSVFMQVDTSAYKKGDSFDYNKIKDYDIVVIECLERFLWRLKFEKGLR